MRRLETLRHALAGRAEGPIGVESGALAEGAIVDPPSKLSCERLEHRAILNGTCRAVVEPGDQFVGRGDLPDKPIALRCREPFWRDNSISRKSTI
jgi:hypothetical protein